MKRATVNVFASLLVLTISIQSLAGQGSKTDERERAQKAAAAFQEIMAAPDQGIPQELLDRAQCVAVFPSVKKGGFIFGGQYGKGLISCRRAQGSWGSPAYFTIGGGSFGLQIGGQAVDLVLLVMNKSGLDGLLQDKFEIGAGAAVSAGPVGRNAHVSTDVLLKSQIISYSRSRGLFGGLELKGAVITQDKSANKDIYEQEISAREIIVDGKVRTPTTIRIFPSALRKFSPKGISN
ncbi:MAG TPA: lipid-binding SYLF domain-containing protein [Blastocatellia bacterium]|jgi:lipid-binding SYLF domain-containing protein|nr:lipid-binding SYLF domain-containing protein [Blastocatellia bacterium]